MHKITTKFNNLSLYKKILFIIAVSISCIYSVFFISTRFLSQKYEQVLYETNAALLEHVSASMETGMTAIESLSNDLLTNSIIQDGLYQLAENPQGSRTALVRRDLYEALYPYTFYNQYIESINLLLPDGTRICMGNSANIDRFPVDSMEQQITEAKGKVVWIPETAPGNYVACGRQIRQMKFLTLEHLASLYIVVDIRDMIADCLENAGYSPENSYFVLMADGSRLYPQETFHDQLCLQLMEKSANSGSNYFIETIDGRKQFIIRGSIPHAGWQYLYFRDYNSLFHQTQTAKLMALLLTICFGILTLFIVQIAFRHVLRHLDYLVQKIRCFGSGAPAPVDERAYDYEHRMDEIGQLHRSFDEMTKSVKVLKDENYDKQLLLQDATIKMLRQQINPHFLYNTLDTVNWLAQKYGAEDISLIVRSLANLFRSTISGQRDLIPLDEELAILNNYITIQKIRFKDRLDFQLSTPENTSHILVPKLSIQPLVENALKYAMENTDETCVIRVIIVETETDCRITVANTGSQFEENLLWKLQNKEIIPQGSGVGLMNIDSRLKLLYGTRYGLHIYNKNEMAVVMLSIPKETEKQHA